MALTLNYGMVKLSEFFNHVVPEIPGFVPSLVEQEIRTSAIDYCRRTRVWQETVNDVTVANEPSYSIDYPNDALFYEPRAVLIDGKPITPFTPDGLTLQVPTWRTETGMVSKYTVVDESSIFLYRIPDTGGQALEVDAVFLPTEQAVRLPDFLLNRHHVIAITKGAKYRLMFMGKKPWTDRDLASKYENDVDSLIGAESFRVAQGKTRLPARVTVCHGVK